MGNQNVLCGAGMEEFTDIMCGMNFVSSNDFSERYKIGKKLGEGGYAVVYLCTRKSDGKKFAVKAGKRSQMKSEDVSGLKAEFRMMKTLDHPNLITAVELYEEQHNFFVVLEFVEGGELFQRLMKRKQYNEADARTAAKLILQGIEYMHSKDVVHRDLKPENILLASRTCDTDIRIADFGLARIARNETIKERSGTPNFVSPELISGKPYGKPADMWAFGVILYMLLGGYPPFKGDSLKHLFRRINAAHYKFHKQRWSAVSEEAKSLVRGLLVVDTKKRLSAAQALAHPWMQEEAAELEKHDLNGAKECLQRFNPRKKLRGAIHSVIALNRLRLSVSASADTNDTQRGLSPLGVDRASSFEADVDSEAEAMEAAARAVGLRMGSPLKDVDAPEYSKCFRKIESEADNSESDNSDMMKIRK